MILDYREYLCTLINTAVDSKDTPATRDEQLDHLLTLLLSSTREAWFQPWFHEKLSEIYPTPKRTLLDAALQAFIAAGPKHCGYVLPSQLNIPGSTSLKAPLRRDVAALFRPNSLLPSSWPQQDAVCCSIVSCLAATAAEQLHMYSQALHSVLSPTTAQSQQLTAHPASFVSPQQLIQGQVRWPAQRLSHHQQQQQPPSPSPQHTSQNPGAHDAADAVQRASTAIAWLVDCLLQSVPQHKLHLLRLAVASFVYCYTALDHLQQQQQQDHLASLHQAVPGEPRRAGEAVDEPAAKRRRLQESAVPVAAAAAGSGPVSHAAHNGSQPPNPAALHSAVQLLVAVCSCAALQRNTQQLLPLAAVVAAEVSAAHPVLLQHRCSQPLLCWLWRRLCSAQAQAASTAATDASPPTVAAAAAAGAVSSPGLRRGSVTGAEATESAGAGKGAVQQQQQLPAGLTAPTPPGLSPGDALNMVLQHLVLSAEPDSLVRCVDLLMDAALPAAASPAAATAGGFTDAQPQPAHSADAAATVRAFDYDKFSSWLLQAAQQWRQVLPAAAATGSSSRQPGSSAGRGGRRGAAAKPAPALQLQQLMPPAAPLTAAWICKQVVPGLCQLALKEWQQHTISPQQPPQQQQQQHVQLQQQQQQHVPGAGQQQSSRPSCRATAALAQLLAADGLLLPPSGEAMVTARALAGALSSLPPTFQQCLVHAWQSLLLARQLQHRQVPAAQYQVPAVAGGAGQAPRPAAADDAVTSSGSGAAGTAGDGVQQGLGVPVLGPCGPLLPWDTLKPMLCLLNHLSDLDESPVAGLLAAALCSCVSTAAAAEGAAAVARTTAASAVSAGRLSLAVGRSGSAGSQGVVWDVLRHLLSPLRFKQPVPVRVWLLVHVLTGQQACCSSSSAGSSAGQQEGPVAAAEGGQAAGGTEGPADAGAAAQGCILDALDALLTRDLASQLTEGLQQLATTGQGAGAGVSQHDKAEGAAATSSAARELAEVVQQLLTQLQQHSAAGGQLAHAAAEQLQAALLRRSGSSV